MSVAELIQELRAALDGKPTRSWRSLAEACVKELESLGAASKEQEGQQEPTAPVPTTPPPATPAGAKPEQSNPASSTQNKS